jgi:hypothetical protein
MVTNTNELKNKSALETYLNQMWLDYCEINPQAFEIYTSLLQTEHTVLNDHIALRTFNHPKLGIRSLAQHFQKYGYSEAGEYFFTEKKLYAKHYENINPEMPKIFISELQLEKVSPYIQNMVSQIADQIPESQINKEGFVFGGKYWPASYDVYERLAQESEYASWVYAFGFRPNHFTVNVNNLKNIQDITELNTLLKSQGYLLNASGGEVKGTAKELLEQSSTMANETLVEFTEGKHSIPGCYYEFAKRYPQSNGKLYQGFIASSADKIFESTNKIQK